MDRKFMLIAVVIAAALLLGVSTIGGFFTTSVLSVSAPTMINGREAVLVTMSAGGSAADGIAGELSKSKYPQFDTTKTFMLTAQKKSDQYQYTLTDRPSSAGTIYIYELTKQCNGLFDCGLWTFATWKAQCLQENSNNLFFDGGSVLDPKWRCYTAKPKWLVSDFNTIGGTSNPYIDVFVDDYGTGAVGGNLLAQYATELSKAHTQDSLEYNGVVIGTASITGLDSTFTSPPSSSGIKAIRPAGQTTGFIPVSGYLDAEYSNSLSTFSTQLAQAKNPSAGQYVIGFGSAGGITAFESMNLQLAANAINNYNSRILALASLSPQGDFQNIDTSKLQSNKIVSLKNDFYIPTVKFELYADKIGIVRPLATPTSATCSNKELPGGSTTGEFKVNVINGGTPGAIYVEYTCTNPLTVTTPAGEYVFTAGENKQLSIGVTLAPNNATSTCTVKASGNGVTKTGTCSVAQTSSCTNTPKLGFYLDKYCNEYCPLTLADCASPKILKAPSTGYPNLCQCDAGTIPPTCNNNGVCDAGEVLPCSDCVTIPPDGACLPFVQKQTTQVIGGITIPFLGNIGGTVVGSCVWDFTLLGFAMLGLAFVLMRMHKPKYAQVVGIAGIAMILLSFIGDNALLLALGGGGIFLIFLVIAVVYLVIRLKLI
jgi:hypothetical protein